LCWPFPRPRRWRRPVSVNGRSSFTATNCGVHKPLLSGWKFSPGLRPLAVRSRSPLLRVCWSRAWPDCCKPWSNNWLTTVHASKLCSTNTLTTICLASLPGAGAKLAPRLLAELAGADWSQLSQVQARAGTAPVTYESGNTRRVKIRRACTHPLRATLHLWADLSRHYSAWAAAFYRAHRDKGQSHSCALRCLAHRWLEIIGAMSRTHTNL